MLNPTSPVVHTGVSREPGVTNWYWPTCIFAVAVLVRFAFFTGFLGSDEVTYTGVAVDLANGIWSNGTYVGALRYGVNLPNGMFIKLLGPSEFSANLWSLLTSAGEVSLVFVAAHRMWGLRAALLSAAVICLLPLHVNLGGRILADAPVAFFITLSFFLFSIAEKRQSAGWYLATGLAAGFVFWIKEVLLVYCVAFAVYSVAYRTWKFKWLWILLGGTLAIGANCALMWEITGDPLHIFKLVRATTEKYVYVLKPDDSPSYYLRYFFVDVRHTWIMPYLALGGVCIWARRALLSQALDRTTGYVVVWAAGLFAVFSVLPISFSPLTFLAKQTNYMAIFVAPFCMLAGFFLAALPCRWMTGLLVAYVAGAVVLSGLEQQAVHVFTANSRGAVAFARGESTASVHGSVNAERAGTYAALLDKSTGGKRFVNPIDALAKIPDPTAGASPAKRYAVVDTETFGWTGNDIIQRLSDVPSCWNRIRQLEPAPGSGLGYYIAAGMLAAVRVLPPPISDRLAPHLDKLVRPRPAYIYKVLPGCVLDAKPGRAK